MAESPVSASPFHKAIDAAGRVRTKGGFATLQSVLLFLALIFVLFLTDGRTEVGLAAAILAIWAGFMVYAFDRDGTTPTRQARRKRRPQ